MPDLSEIVFENVELAELANIFDSLEASNVISMYMDGENCTLATLKSDDFVSRLKHGSHFFVNLKVFEIDGTALKNCSLQIITYDKKFDVNLIFVEDEMEKSLNVSNEQALQKLATKFASMYSISSYFGGLEPAIDVETRYFTNDKMSQFPP